MGTCALSISVRRYAWVEICTGIAYAALGDDRHSEAALRCAERLSPGYQTAMQIASEVFGRPALRFPRNIKEFEHYIESAVERSRFESRTGF